MGYNDCFSDIWMSFILGIDHTWSWCIIHFIYFWILFANNLLRILVSIFVRDVGQLFSLFVLSLSGICIRGNTSFIKCIGKDSLLFSEEIVQNWCYFIFIHLVEFSVKLSGPGDFFFGRFKIINSIFKIVTQLLKLFISHWMSWVSLWF